MEYVYVCWSPLSNSAEATLQSPADFHLGRSSWAVGMAEGCDRAQRTGGPAVCVCVVVVGWSCLLNRSYYTHSFDPLRYASQINVPGPSELHRSDLRYPCLVILTQLTIFKLHWDVDPAGQKHKLGDPRHEKKHWTMNRQIWSTSWWSNMATEFITCPTYTWFSHLPSGNFSTQLWKIHPFLDI